MTFPEQLQQHREALEKMRKDSLLIHGKIGKTAVMESKFGGRPYWLKSDAYPTTQAGEPLHLIAQINFDEIEEMIPGYPTEGILQFFIADEELYGADFEHPTKQDTFRVIYHDKIETDLSKLKTDFPYQSDEFYFPISEECKLSFERTSEMLPICDYRFNEITGIEELLETGTDESFDLYDQIEDAYDQLASGQGAKIGGYPYFTQDDPRSSEVYAEYDTVLLQIDTEVDLKIMWGDCGVANFFITAEDLRKRNFSNVLYTWDCH